MMKFGAGRAIRRAPAAKPVRNLLGHAAAVIASSELAAALDVRRGTPLLRMAQTDYNTNAQPMLYLVEYHRPDIFVFLVNCKGPHW